MAGNSGEGLEGLQKGDSKRITPHPYEICCILRDWKISGLVNQVKERRDLRASHSGEGLKES